VSARGNYQPSEAQIQRQRRRARRDGQRPGKRQLQSIYRIERELGLEHKWVGNRVEARHRLRKLRAAQRAAAARGERERQPDQWALPAASFQLFELRRRGIEVCEPISRREADDLLHSRTRAPTGAGAERTEGQANASQSA
jgi:hypothetical protein